MMAFLGKVFGGFSGLFVETFQSLYGFQLGWMSFYIFTSLLAIPAIILIYQNKVFFNAKVTNS
jgi:PAT family beta-lactamase induction signal transducer AmpG